MIQQPQGLFSLLIKVSFSRAQRCLLICAAHHSPPWCRLQGAGLSRVSPRPVLEQPDPESTNKNMRTLNIELGNSSIFFLNKFYWRLVDLQCCVSFRSTAKWVSHTHSCVCVCVCVCIYIYVYVYIYIYINTPVFLMGKSHWQGILKGYSPWGCKESHTAEHHAHTHMHIFYIAALETYEYNAWLLSSC